MISNTCDARRIGRLLGYTKHILVIIMVRETSVILLKIGRYEVAKRRRASQDIQGIIKKL